MEAQLYFRNIFRDSGYNTGYFDTHPEFQNFITYNLNSTNTIFFKPDSCGYTNDTDFDNSADPNNLNVISILCEFFDSRDGYRNGVNTIDLLRIAYHLNSSQPFTTGYQFISADADGNASITSNDQEEMEDVILGTANYFTRDSWEWVHELDLIYGSFTTTNYPNPYAYTFSNYIDKTWTRDSITKADIETSLSDTRYIHAIKVGDVKSNQTSGNNDNRSVCDGITYSKKLNDHIEGFNVFNEPIFDNEIINLELHVPAKEKIYGLEFSIKIPLESFEIQEVKSSSNTAKWHFDNNTEVLTILDYDSKGLPEKVKSNFFNLKIKARSNADISSIMWEENRPRIIANKDLDVVEEKALVFIKKDKLHSGQNILAYQQNGDVYIEAASPIKSVYLYSTDGRLLTQKEVNGVSNNFLLGVQDLQITGSSIAVLSVVSYDGEVQTQKLFIQK